MSILSRIFGQKKPEPTETAEEYNGFRIYPAPVKDGSQYRVNARIELDVDGEIKTHNLIRADTVGSLEEATTFTIRKAKQVIDEQGARLFQ